MILQTVATDVTHWSTADNDTGQGAAVADAVGDKSDYSEENYKTGFEIWMENSKLQFERENNERSLPPLDLTPAGAKKLDEKTPATDS